MTGKITTKNRIICFIGNQCQSKKKTTVLLFAQNRELKKKTI